MAALVRSCAGELRALLGLAPEAVVEQREVLGSIDVEAEARKVTGVKGKKGEHWALASPFM